MPHFFYKPVRHEGFSVRTDGFSKALVLHLHHKYFLFFVQFPSGLDDDGFSSKKFDLTLVPSPLEREVLS
jgi:hypothetical protein